MLLQKITLLLEEKGYVRHRSGKLEPADLDTALNKYFKDMIDAGNREVAARRAEANKPVKEQEEDPVDTITMDVPLFIRILEYSREDAQTDMDLHDLAEKAIAGTKQQGILSMDDYDMLTSEQEQLAEASVPSNIREFAKRKGVSSLVNKVAGWAERVGKRITGGTAVGRDYDTLVLDMGYQTSDIRIDCDEETVELYGEPVSSFADFKRVFEANSSRVEENMSLDDEAKAYFLAKIKRGEIDTLPEDPKAAFLAQMTKDQMAHDEETLRRERNLQEKIREVAETIKLGQSLNESTLCKRGQDYIKARKAAGEKSSAYLSGRAVKVCKGDIEFKGKKQKDFKG